MPLRKKRLLQSKKILYLNIVFLVLLPIINLFWDLRIAAAEFIAALIIVLLTFYGLYAFKSDARRIVKETARNLGSSDVQALQSFPLPVAVINDRCELEWCNNLFRFDVVNGNDSYRMQLKAIFNGIPNDFLKRLPSGVDLKKPGTEKNMAEKKYTVYGSLRADGCYQLYFIDNTELKNTVAEYALSRPVVAIIMIDSYDELMQNAKEGEKAEIVSMIEKQLTAWVSQTSGFLRHSDRDKYLFVFEERHFKKIVETRFDILDKVRQIPVGEYMTATLSIGVGHGGASFAENEDMARQALDMALGRGGDQAAVRTAAGYEFYGGVSKVVEKRTKVKTRIIASALSELIGGSDNVLIMGHKATDLDFIGAASGLYKAILSRGTDARIVVSYRDSLAKQLIDQLKKEGYEEAFIEPDESLFLVTPKTLLIVADTHRKGFVEYPELYKAVKTVAVIDHHRKMVDFIDNAVLFYHEPYASSASEMVTELVQYIADKSVSVVEASALLAGITLDTRNFSVRTGVRTFEAAAYLRRKGADTAKVKELFAGSMEDYKSRARLVASASIYNRCAIAIGNNEIHKNIRIIAPQAADDLLQIVGVDASFVLYHQQENGIFISARSMGKVNVQLVMEKLGGGGHMTMAGAQLATADIEEVKNKLMEAIDAYFAENAKQ